MRPQPPADRDGDGFAPDWSTTEFAVTSADASDSAVVDAACPTDSAQVVYLDGGAPEGTVDPAFVVTGPGVRPGRTDLDVDGERTMAAAWFDAGAGERGSVVDRLASLATPSDAWKAKYDGAVRTDTYRSLDPGGVERTPLGDGTLGLHPLSTVDEPPAFALRAGPSPGPETGRPADALVLVHPDADRATVVDRIEAADHLAPDAVRAVNRLGEPVLRSPAHLDDRLAPDPGRVPFRDDSSTADDRGASGEEGAEEPSEGAEFGV